MPKELAREFYASQRVNSNDKEQDSASQKSQSIEQDSLLAMSIRVFIALLACAGYMSVSTWLIVLNRNLMAQYGFKYPITLSSMGVIFSVFSAYVATRILKVSPANQQVTRRTYIRSVLPIGFFHALTLYLGNAVYMYLSMAFIQMMKATCPVFVMLALFSFKLESPSTALIFSVVIITVGAILSSYGEVNFSTFGLAIQILSEIAEGLRLAMTQFCLVGLKFEPMEGLVYLGSASALWLSAGAIILEGPQIVASGDLQIVAQNPFLFAQAAVLGFGVNLLSLVVIKLTSSLTLKILATAKNTMVVFFSILFLKEIVTGIQGLGYVVSLAGLGYYNFLKLPRKVSGKHYQ